MERDEPLEQLFRLVGPAEERERFDEPERADRERRPGHAEVVGGRVAPEQAAVERERVADRVDVGGRARVVGREEPEVDREQERGVELRLARDLGQGAEVVVPAPRGEQLRRAPLDLPRTGGELPRLERFGHLHRPLRARLQRLARQLDGVIGIGVKATWDGAEIYVEPDRPFPTASVFNIPVLLELLLQAEEGRLSLDERVAVTEALKSPGSGVLKELSSSPHVSLSDLAMLMIIISDNTATDILVQRVGVEALNRRLAAWGFAVTRVPMDCRRLLFEMAGRPDGPFTPEARVEVEKILRTRERAFTGRAYADADNNLTTPREMIRLLEMLVTDRPLSPRVRELALFYMRKQQIRDRLPLHLPPDTDVAHKTGSIGGVRNDAGILFVPRGPVLVCAFTRDLKEDLAGAAAIAEVGRLVHAAFA